VYKYEKDSLKTEDSKMSAHFTEKAVYNYEDTHPFLKTSFENKFYSLDDNGKIAFYEFDGKTFKKVRESGSLSITLPGVKDGAHVAERLRATAFTPTRRAQNFRMHSLRLSKTV